MIQSVKLNTTRWLLLLFLAFLVFLGFLFPVTVMQIREEERQSDKVTLLEQWPIRVGDTFQIIWTHSVTLQPVIEVYRIEDDLTIGIYEMYFNEPGPNLPSAPEGNTQWEFRDGMFRVYNYDGVFQELPVRIGQMVADHTLFYQDRTYALEELSRPGGFITLRARRIHAIQFLYEEGRLWLIKKMSR